MNGSRCPVLSLCEVNGTAGPIDLGPCAGILLIQPHSGIHGQNKLREVLWEPLADRLTHSVVFLSGQIA